MQIDVLIVGDPDTEESSVPGVYLAGDVSRDVLLVAVAIGEGAGGRRDQ
jgi:thioredoxin reductase